jgi:ABC-type enterochelin transport system ATPase subunit
VRDFGQTIVMVTHDPNAASYADRVIFLGDGQIVDEMRDPTAEAVLDRLKHLDVQLPDPDDPVPPRDAATSVPDATASPVVLEGER